MKKYFNIFILLFGAYIISSCGTSGNKEVKTELKDEGPTNEFYEVTADLQKHDPGAKITDLEQIVSLVYPKDANFE